MKLDNARSLLYRSQILQENMRWKALAKIYKMYSFAPFSKLILPLKIAKQFAIFLPNFAKFVKISLEFVDFRADFCVGADFYGIL